MIWHGYFLLRVNAISPADATAATLAIASLGQQWCDNPCANPCNITQIKTSVDSLAVIVEATLDHVPLRSNAVAGLASAWGISESVADARVVDWQVFAGETIAERQDAVRTYIAANVADWEVVVVV